MRPSTSRGSVRPAAVAGSFYPADPARLANTVDHLLAAAAGGPTPKPTPRQAPKAIVVPHAGYRYSGPVAASAYALLRGAPVSRVVLVGPAHFVALDGAAVPTVAAFATPVGAVPVDDEARRTILGLPATVESDGVHAEEHSLEVQLPFLQRVLPAGFTVLPVAVGRADARTVAELLDLVWADAQTLIVVSTDLSHYLDSEAARRRDAATAAAVVALDAGRIGPSDACGALPLRGLLLAARRRGMRGQQLDLRTSGDAAGDRSRVVGYGAFALYGTASAPG